jgi:hypothetical protein
MYVEEIDAEIANLTEAVRCDNETAVAASIIVLLGGFLKNHARIAYALEEIQQNSYTAVNRR